MTEVNSHMPLFPCMQWGCAFLNLDFDPFVLNVERSYISNILPKHKKRRCVPVVCKSFYFARNGLRAEYRHPLSCHLKIMCGTDYILETTIYLIQYAMKFTSFEWITQNVALFWLLTRFRDFAIYFKMASGVKMTS